MLKLTLLSLASLNWVLDCTFGAFIQNLPISVIHRLHYFLVIGIAFTSGQMFEIWMVWKAWVSQYKWFTFSWFPAKTGLRLQLK